MTHYLRDLDFANFELYCNKAVPFTRWVVSKGYLRDRLVVVDVGCRDGLLQGWDVLEDLFELHSFDAAPDAVEAIRLRDTGKPNRFHYAVALGDEERVRPFFKKQDRFSSSLYRSSASDVEVTVPIRRLDGLLHDGKLPRADFIKIDVEGHEPAVLRGAENLIRNSPTLGLEIETNFNVSPVFPRTHFTAVHELLMTHWFVLMDLNYDRVPHGRYREEAERLGSAARPDAPFWGSPSTFNVLFCRDFCQEADQAHHYPTEPHATPGIESLIKMLIIFEMYGCIDRAVDLLIRFKERFTLRFDCDRAARLLIGQDVNKGRGVSL
jgi:FkbM family methyltransferase